MEELHTSEDCGWSGGPTGMTTLRLKGTGLEPKRIIPSNNHGRVTVCVTLSFQARVGVTLSVASLSRLTHKA